MPEAFYGRSNRWLTVVLITPDAFGADPEQVRLALEDENIESRPVWKPMHMQPVFRVAVQSSELKAKNKAKKTFEARVVGGEVAEDLFDRGLCLPSGTAMTHADMDRVVDVIMKGSPYKNTGSSTRNPGVQGSSERRKDAKGQKSEVRKKQRSVISRE